ncbi:MAG: EF-hand domain-containing protein [Deltaproteobacteria bacterium]|nr:EF-hand domain-containing protein [Deltaproteobacteria bacterium]
MSDSFSFNLLGYSQDELYDHLRGVYERARRCFHRESDPDYDFQVAEGRINLIGVRGFLAKTLEPSSRNTNTFWDDTLFVIFINGGNKKVIHLQLSTEHRSKPGKSSLMMPGMYKYRLGQHKRGDIIVKQVDENNNFIKTAPDEVVARPFISIERYGFGNMPGAPPPPKSYIFAGQVDQYGIANSNSGNPANSTSNDEPKRKTIKRETWAYRALNPCLDSGNKSQIVESDNSLTRSPGEKFSFGKTLNIHYGGKEVIGPQKFSEGCQVIYNWERYCTFIRQLEKDGSIDGTEDNLIEPTDNTTPKRPVIYTLVEGYFLKPAAIGYPVFGETAASLFAATEASTRGLFPIGDNGFWHGGVHLKPKFNTSIRAIADGEVVAYRLDKEAKAVTIQGIEHKFATGFVLMRHRFKTPNGATIAFYSHYMHLLPFDLYKGNEQGPSFIAKTKFKVATTVDGKGLLIHSATNFKDKLAVVPKGAILEIDMTKTPPDKYCSNAKNFRQATWRGKEGFLDIGTTTNANVRKWLQGPNEYQCIKAKDATLSADARGLAVYKNKIPESKMEKNVPELVQIAPKDSELEFDLPSLVAIDGQPIPGWSQLTDGNWVLVTKTNISCAITIEPEKLDEVVVLNPPLAIAAGSIVGYPGQYDNADSIVHVEILTNNVDFLKNPKSDVGGNKTLQIPAGTAFKDHKLVEVTMTDVNLGPGCKMQISEVLDGFAKVQCTELIGWLKVSDLSGIKINPKTKKHKLYKKNRTFKTAVALSSLAHQNPATSTATAASCSVTIAADTKVILAQNMQESDGDYCQVTLATPASETNLLTGWVAKAVTGEINHGSFILKAALLQLADKHPRSYVFKNELGKNSKVLLVDVPNASDDADELIKQIDTNRDNLISDEEYKQSMVLFRTLCCLNPSEWEPPKDKYKRVLGPPWNLSNDDYQKVVGQVEKLAWWTGLPADLKKELETTSGSSLCWHLHPIGFLQQLERLAQAGLVVAGTSCPFTWCMDEDRLTDKKLAHDKPCM